MPHNLDRTIATAVAAGDAVHGTTSPNPPVGAAILDAFGNLVGVGGTRPAGGAHAEIVALNAAGERARGGIAVVTLEPCNHTGRTGPCAPALLDAGIDAVYYLNPDPNPTASGGADFLRAHGVHVAHVAARTPALEPWLTAMRLGRPHVTLKFAQSLDGFTAAVDGSSQWITSAAARAHVHRDRLRRDAIIIGTGTALADDPSLTARDQHGTAHPAASQPRRVVVGTRDITEQAHNLVRLGFEQYDDIDSALAALWESGSRDVLVEGGAALAGAFLRADRVDAIRAYIAPLLLGEGRSVLTGGLAQTLAEGARFIRTDHYAVGDDIVLDLTRKEDT